MAPGNSAKILALAHRGVELIDKLEERRKRTFQQQKDFQKLYEGELEIYSQLDQDSDEDVTAQELPTDSGIQETVVCIQPNYKIAISSDGATLKLYKLPLSLGTLDEEEEAGTPKTKGIEFDTKVENILKYMIAFGQEQDNFRAGCADVSGAFKALRRITFEGPREAAGDLADPIDEYYNTKDLHSGPDFREIVRELRVYHALLGSSIGSIAPKLLLESSTTSPTPTVSKVMIKREEKLRVIEASVVQKYMSDLNRELETVRPKFGKALGGSLHNARAASSHCRQFKESG